MCDDEIHDQQVIVLASKPLSRVLGDETVILHLEAGKYYSLNRVGTEAWKRIHSEPTVRDLRNFLLATFDVGEDELRRDLHSLLRSLRDHGLIRIQ